MDVLAAVLAQIHHKPDLDMQLKDGYECGIILTVTGFLFHHFFTSHFFSLLLSHSSLCTGPGQKESSGGDQSLHHPVPGQRGLPDQCLSQQCTAAAGHPGLAAAAHGVLHQPHLPGQKYTQILNTDLTAVDNDAPHFPLLTFTLTTDFQTQHTKIFCMVPFGSCGLVPVLVNQSCLSV